MQHKTHHCFSASRPALAMLFALLTMLSCLSPAFASPPPERPSLGLSTDEEAYLAEHPTLHLAVLDGAAPVVSLTSDGDYTGITKAVSNRIEALLGVKFICVPIKSSSEISSAIASSSAELFCIPANYAQTYLPDTPLTRPYLTAGTVLFYRNGIKPNRLSGKTCALVAGAQLPEGVDEENIFYATTRLEAVEAVSSGLADFGYGNEFSIGYYIGLKQLTNISTIPNHAEQREYCYAVLNGEPLLLSALNKAIAQIDSAEMQSIVFSSCVLPERPLTLSDLLAQFSSLLIGIGALIVLGLTCFVIYIIRTNRKLKMQNLRLVTLAEVSGDLMFEYEVNSGHLLLSKQFRDVFNIPFQSKHYDKSSIAGIVSIDDILRRRINGEELTLPNGQCYKAVYSYVHGSGAAPLFMVGKLVDISAQKARIEALAQKARFDGLTHILNSAECRLAAERYLSALPSGQHDALMIIDIDSFKNINDSKGHYIGDQILIKTAEVLRDAFRSQDVVGRLGGDEFLIYMHAVGSKAALIAKCQDVLQRLRFPLADDESAQTSSASIGVYVITKPVPFDEAYQKADCALYAAKSGGKDGFCVFPSAEEKAQSREEVPL